MVELKQPKFYFFFIMSIVIICIKFTIQMWKYMAP